MKNSSEQLYQDYLVEMDSLERFRQRFQRTYPNAPMDREDPDVRRLVEALAFFSVQTRRATQHNLNSTWLRLFSSYFEFLLEPLPALAMVKAVPTEKMVETVVLPRGTELRLTPAEGVAGSFRLQRDLRVLPLFLDETSVVRLANGGHRLILRFESTGERRDPVETLSFHVRHLGEYRSSLAVYHSLRKHLEQVTVFYDRMTHESAAGERCTHSFGREAPAPDDAAHYAHPLQRVRTFFQAPEQGLFLHVQVPASRKAWRSLYLCLDLKKEWTVGRSTHPDFLEPFVAPVVNLKAEPAQPILVDGTRSEFPILSMSPGRQFHLQSVTGVYELTKAGRAPMRPAFLPGDGPSYEIEEVLDERLHLSHRLLVQMPEAFNDPRKLLVEALWYQPQFAPQASGRLEVSTPSRHVEGLKWEAVGSVQPHRESPLRNDVVALTRLLSWKVKPTLTLSELTALLSYFGTPVEGVFRQVIPWMRSLQASVLPDGALRGSGVRHVYDMVLEPFDSSFEPLVACFLEQVLETLDAWNGEAMVELRPTVAGAGDFPLEATR